MHHPLQVAVAAAAASGPHATPAMATSDPADPRAIFLARTNMLHRQAAADNGSLPGRALSNKVVPLQGIAIPAGMMRGAAPSAAIRPTAPVATDENGAPQTLPTNPPLVISRSDATTAWCVKVVTDANLLPTVVGFTVG